MGFKSIFYLTWVFRHYVFKTVCSYIPNKIKLESGMPKIKGMQKSSNDIITVYINSNSNSKSNSNSNSNSSSNSTVKPQFTVGFGGRKNTQ